MLRNVLKSVSSLAELRPVNKWTPSRNCEFLVRFVARETSSSLLKRTLHLSSLLDKENRRDMISSAPRRDQGSQGEKSLDVDMSHSVTNPLFPNERTCDMLVDGVRFVELPVCNLKVSKNNTIMTLTDFRGKIILRRSCGLEGFKNAKKGTNIAAQTTGLSLGKKALVKGIKNVRIKVQGLGPGRMASVQGLQMSGVNIVSITDDTPMPLQYYPRPRKQRRL